MDLDRLGVWMTFDGVSMPQAIETAQRIEEIGYGAIWHPMSVGRDLMLTAASVLADTRKLVFATGIIPLFERSPGVLAAGQAFLDEQSGGRFLLGLGVSHPQIVEGMHGETYQPPLAAMRSYLDRIDRGLDLSAILGLPPADHSQPPVQTGPPRVLGALGPKMTALARDRAQGSHSYFMPPEHTETAAEILGPDRMLCPEIKIVRERDPTRARDAARGVASTYLQLENYCRSWRAFGFEDDDLSNGGSDRFIDSIVAWGDDARIEAFLQRHFDAGATHLALQFISPAGAAPGPDWGAIERFSPRSVVGA